jgi:hypothetical protein
MNPMPEIIPMLKQLRLSGILDSLETRNRQMRLPVAARKDLPPRCAGPTSATRKRWRSSTLASTPI